MLGLGFLPVADAEGGNPICISTRTDDFGTVWFHDHELDFDEDGAFTQIAPSWDAFIDATRPPCSPTRSRQTLYLVRRGQEPKGAGRRLWVRAPRDPPLLSGQCGILREDVPQAGAGAYSGVR